MLLLKFLPLFGLVALSNCNIIFLGSDGNKQSIYEMMVSEAVAAVDDNTEDADNTVPPGDFGIDHVINSTEGDLNVNKGCSCDKSGCKCCQKLKISKVKIHGDLCEQVTYLSEKIGLQLEVTFNGKVLIKKKVSVQNPPPICVKIPGLKKGAKACIKFYDMSVTGKKLKGCSKIEVKLFKIKVISVDLGCFTIPFLEHDVSFMDEENLISSEEDTLDSPNEDPNDINDANKNLLKADLEDPNMDDQESNDMLEVPEVDIAEAKGCSCDSGGCKCCQKLKISKVKLDGDVCEQFTYLPQELGIQLEVTFNGKVLIKQKVSVQNPPPICVKIPGLKKGAKACITFYDMSVTGKKLKGCSKIEVKLFKIKVISVDLGCFTIPFLEHDVSFMDEENLISSEEDTLDSPNEDPNDINDANKNLLKADLEDPNMDDQESNDMLEVPEVDIAEAKGCSCDSGGCKCCQKLKISKVKLDGDVCEQFTYLPQELGIQLEVTFNGKVLIKQKVSVKNPPPLCLKIPGLKKKASACIQFYNLAVSGKQLKGCSKMTIKLFHVKVASIDLGCFTLPFRDTSDLIGVSQLKPHNTQILLRAISLMVERMQK